MIKNSDFIITKKFQNAYKPLMQKNASPELNSKIDTQEKG